MQQVDKNILVGKQQQWNASRKFNQKFALWVKEKRGHLPYLDVVCPTKISVLEAWSSVS